MSFRADRDRLLDIVEAGDKVAARVAQGRAAFDADEDRQLATVRLLEIVGEAASQVSAEVRAGHPQVPWVEAVRLRNRVVHGYFAIDFDVVWDTAAHDLPAFVAGVRAVLDSGGI